MRAVALTFGGALLGTAAACGSNATESQSADAQPQSADAQPQSADAQPQSADAQPQSADAQPPDGGIVGSCTDGYQDPVAIFDLGNDHPAELSGLAISRKNPGVLWTHDDGDNEPRIYALNMEGVILGYLELATPLSYPPYPASSGDFAFNNDWEDCDIGRCGDDDCIYVADFGDNSASKQDDNPDFHYTVYQVVEPTVDPDSPFGVMVTEQWYGYPYRYPDSSHNAEALAVSPEGLLYVFSKEQDGGGTGVYRFPALESLPARQFLPAPYLLTLEGNLELPAGLLNAVTGASIHALGTRLALRTYLDVFEYSAGGGGSWGTATLEIEAPRLSYPSESPQGEAVAYHPVTGHIFTLSERPAGGLFGTASLHEFACQ